MVDTTLVLKDWVQEYLFVWLLNVLFALIILIVGRLIAKMLVKFLVKVLRRSALDEMLINFSKSVVYGILILLILAAALDRLGVNVSSFAAVLGAAGLTIGLALQGSLQNFAAGVMLLLFRPFKVGDWVELAGVPGLVKRVGVFTTILKTTDYREIFIPNGSIYKGNIVNYYSLQVRRLDLLIRISYTNDVALVKQLIMQILQSHPQILPEPVPVVVIEDLSLQAVVLSVRPWVKSELYMDIRFDLNEKIKQLFDQHGVVPPTVTTP